MRVLSIGVVEYIDMILIEKLLRVWGIINTLVLQEISVFLRLKILSSRLSNVYGE